MHPDFARRRLGRALLEHAAATARRAGLPALTLTTFVEVPWNGPYYERCGFRWLAEEELTPGLRAVRETERARGLDRWPRGCMSRALRSRRIRTHRPPFRPTRFPRPRVADTPEGYLTEEAP